MADRIQQMRQELYKMLKVIGTPGSWNTSSSNVACSPTQVSHVSKCDYILPVLHCMSSLFNTATQVEFLTRKYHIYLMKSGRINMCGLNSRNMEYVASAIKDAVTTHPEK